MAETKKEKGVDDKSASEAYKALESSSSVNRGFLFTFLLFEVYMMITVGLTSDIQLLVPDRGVHLPFVNMEIPLLQFSIIAPILLLAVHFNLLMHLYQHSIKLSRWQKVVGSSESEDSTLIPPFLFNYVVRYQKGDVSYYLLVGSLYLIIYFFPLAVLLMTQVIFSRYHSFPTTLWHFVVLFADLQFSMLYWRRIICPENEDERRRDWKQTLKEQNKCVFVPLLKIILLVPVWNALLMILRCALQPRGTLGDIRSEGVFRYYYKSTIGKVNMLTLFSSGVVGFALFNLILMISLFTGLYPKDPSYSRLYPNLEIKGEDLSLDKTRDDELDLKGRNLEFAKFKEFSARLNASGACLQGADLSKARLNGSNLKGAYLQGANLFEVELQEADLSNAELQRADLSNSIINGADLTDANLHLAALRNAKLFKATLNGAQLKGSYLNGVQMQRAYLNGAQLQGVALTGAQLQGAYLNLAQFQGGNLEMAQFQGANLTDARFQGTDLTDAEFQGAILTNAEFQGANLTGTQFQGTNLTNAEIQWTDLNKVNFNGSILEKTRLHGSLINSVSDFHFLGKLNIDIDADWLEISNDVLNELPDGIKAEFENNIKQARARVQEFSKEEAQKLFSLSGVSDINEFINVRKKLSCRYNEKPLKDEYVAEGLLEQYSDDSIISLINEHDKSITSEKLINNMQLHMNLNCPDVAKKVDWDEYLKE